MSYPTKVLDEDLGALIEAFQYFKCTEQKDGSYRITSKMPNEVAAPLLRAFMRREARLLREDADRMDAPFSVRTPEQRRADALVDLLLSIDAASRYFG